MKAAYISRHGSHREVLQVGELPDPTPGPGEVRVRVRSAALNHLDIWVTGGLPGLKLTFPHVLGGDASGVVDQVGSGVTRWKKGDEVIVHPGLACGICDRCESGWESLCPDYRILGEQVSGTHAELVCIPQGNVFSKPVQLSFDDAAAMPLVSTTAWQMLVKRAQVQRGEIVLVHAAGSGVGSAAIQIAKHLGAQVIATAGSQDKLDLARRLGADHGVCYSDADWVSVVRRLAPKGCDVIFDHLGAKFWESNIKLIRNGGRIPVCGATTGAEATTNLAHVFFRQIQILGSTMGDKRDFPQILELFAQGKLRSVVDKAFPLSQAGEAFDRMDGRKQFGKIILNP